MKKSLSTIMFLFFISSFAIFFSCSKDVVETPITPNINHAPNIPSDPSPADGALNVPRFVSLSWSCTDPDAGDTLRFDIYAGSSNPPVTLVGPNILSNSYDLGLVASSMMVYWRVVAKDNNNAFTEGPVWCFTTSN
jgi:hypothetical protein